MTATENRIDGGPHHGRTLGDMIVAHPHDLIGARGLVATGGRFLFPLLVKLIDAAQPLSIQVHPDDERASRFDALGKSEAWHIIEAVPGSAFFAGTGDGVSLADVEDAAFGGRVAGLMHRIPARVGDTVFLPAGTLHALGAGVVIYELQQASEVTYRLDDWGRVGLDGLPRRLHVAESLDAIVPTVRPRPIEPIPLPGAGRRELLVACRYFALDRFTLASDESVQLVVDESPQVVTVLEGTAALGNLTVGSWRTAVLPAAAGACEVTATAATVLVRAWVPNLMADVVRPALAAGTDPERLAAVSAPWPDVAAAMADV